MSTNFSARCTQPNRMVNDNYGLFVVALTTQKVLGITVVGVPIAGLHNSIRISHLRNTCDYMQASALQTNHFANPILERLVICLPSWNP